MSANARNILDSSSWFYCCSYGLFKSSTWISRFSGGSSGAMWIQMSIPMTYIHRLSLDGKEFSGRQPLYEGLVARGEKRCWSSWPSPTNLRWTVGREPRQAGGGMGRQNRKFLSFAESMPERMGWKG